MKHKQKAPVKGSKIFSKKNFYFETLDRCFSLCVKQLSELSSRPGKAWNSNKEETTMLTLNNKNQKLEKKTILQYDRRGLIVKIENQDYRLISKTKMITRYAAVTKCCKMYGEELGNQEYYLIEEQDEKGFLYRQLISSTRETWIED